MSTEASAIDTRPTWKAYVEIARVDHWFKQAFMLVGSAVGMVLAEIPLRDAVVPTLLAVLSTSLLASANYTINEFLDAATDQFHPTKRNRAPANGKVKGPLVLAEYLILTALGLLVASLLPPVFLMLSIGFVLLGLAYNVPPIRTKDVAYLDVLWESLNNPFRFLLGWSAIVVTHLPPSSILMAFWMGGAFLMSVKRYAEYRAINDPEKAEQYRASYRFYTDETLLLSTFFYALSSTFFLGIFLIKYRIEFLVSFPFFALLYVWYLAIGMKPDSSTQNPEKLYREPRYLLYVLFLAALVTMLLFVEIPMLHIFVESVNFEE